MCEQKSCLDKLREETVKFPEWAESLDDNGNSATDGTSTRPMSSAAGTPAPRSGFKLKLNGRGGAGQSSSRAGTESGAVSEGEDE